MIYSRWRPSKGGYDYFDAPDRDVPLGNDLPTPILPRGTDIGVASTDAGRPLPPGSKFAGSGAEAIGLIAPLRTNALSGLTDMIPPTYLAMAAGVFFGWLVFKKKVKLL